MKEGRRKDEKKGQTDNITNNLCWLKQIEPICVHLLYGCQCFMKYMETLKKKSFSIFIGLHGIVCF